MVIGIDASRANLENRTGTEWYAYHVIQGLKKIIPAEHRVVLYTKEPLRADLAELPPSWEAKVLGWPPVFLWTQMRLSLEIALHRVDLLYVPAHTIPLIHPKRVCVVAHDIGFARQDALYDPATIGGRPLTKRLLDLGVRLVTLGRYSASERDYHRFAMDLAVKKATSIVTISQFSRSEIAEVYPAAADRLLVIPNGFNAPLFDSPPAAETMVKWRIHQPYLLFVGRVEEKKNVPRLLKAWAKLKQSGLPGQLVLAGRPGFGHEAITRQISEAGLGESVLETGYISQEELGSLTACATGFVLPSLYEGFGIPVLEAMAAGVPVACSDIPALRETAGQAALFFDPQDEQAIAEALEKLLTDEAVRAELIERGQEQCGKFSWEKTAQQTWIELERLLRLTT